MYEQFYGLREHPFDLTPNPRFLFLGEGHREGLSALRYGISSRGGSTLLVGEAGTGKTALVHAALQGAQDGVVAAYLTSPALTRDEFVEFLALSLSLDSGTTASKPRFLAELRRVLVDRRRANGVTVLIIDDAQDLPDALLDEVRWLTNLDTATERLLPIVLVGQPELAARLNEPGRQQLKQRLTLRVTLTALGPEETADYVRTRVRVAGGDCDSVFTERALQTIYEASGGLPRTISIICDNALLTGFAVDQRPVDRDVVLEVCRDLDVGGTLSELPVDHNRTRLLDPSITLAQLGAAGPPDGKGSAPTAIHHPRAVPDRRFRLLGLLRSEGDR